MIIDWIEEFDVAFAIKRRNTTFTVDRDITEISGEIAHTGSVTFNDEIEVGDFIGNYRIF